MPVKDYDIVIVGSGPNGLSAAILLQQAGLKTILLEAESTVGGGMRSAELTLPGFTHDICSAIHPLAAGSPFLTSLPLEKFGLEFIAPGIAAAHPFDDGSAATMLTSIQDTSSGLGEDERAYQNLVDPLVKDWPRIVDDVLGPFHFPAHPLAMARFARWALQPAGNLARNQFKGEKAKGLFAGMAAHGMLPFEKMVSSAAGIVL